MAEKLMPRQRLIIASTMSAATLKTTVLKMSTILSRKTLMEAALANDLARVRKCARVFPSHLTELNERGETPLHEYRRRRTVEERCRKVEAQLTPPFVPPSAWTTLPSWYGKPGGWESVVTW